MSNNCLKQQLKGSVSNDNLPVFNTIKLIFDRNSPSNKYAMNLNIYGSYQVKALGGTKIYNSGGTELQSPVSTSHSQTFKFTYNQGDGLLLTQKYNLRWLNSPYDRLDVIFDILELAACIGTMSFKPCVQLKGNMSITGEITDFASKQVIYGRVSGSMTFGLYTGITLNGSLLSNEVTVRYGSDMVSPTEQETAQGWQIAS